jgi:hypothetical protein
MPKSLHLIHVGKKKRGDAKKKKKPPLTLSEVRQRIELPFKADHINLDDLKRAVEQLNMN